MEDRRLARSTVVGVTVSEVTLAAPALTGLPRRQVGRIPPELTLRLSKPQRRRRFSESSMPLVMSSHWNQRMSGIFHLLRPVGNRCECLCLWLAHPVSAFRFKDDLSDSSRRRAVKQLGYYRRMLRATHSREDLEQYALGVCMPACIGLLLAEDAFSILHLTQRSPENWALTSWKMTSDLLRALTTSAPLKTHLKASQSHR